MKLKTINFTVGGLFIWAVIGVTSSHSTKPASRQVAGYPAKAGIQQEKIPHSGQKLDVVPLRGAGLISWIPAFAGMT